jgi:hypothetical protein
MPAELLNGMEALAFPAAYVLLRTTVQRLGSMLAKSLWMLWLGPGWICESVRPGSGDGSDG